MIEINVSVENAAQIQQYLASVRSRSIPFALKRATDNIGRKLAGTKGTFNREWRKHLNARRRNFPGSQIFMKPAKVSGSQISRPTRVFSSAKAESILNAQIHGAIRKPEKSAAFPVPIKRTRTGRASRINPKTSYRAGQYIFRRYKGSRKDELLAVLKPSVTVPPHFIINYIVARARRDLIKEVQIELAREFHNQSRRFAARGGLQAELRAARAI